MASDQPVNIFAGNPLNRASERRTDAAWLEAKAVDAEALAVVLWNKQPLVEPGEGDGLRIAYLPARLAHELAPSSEERLFLGLWKDTPVFAVELSGEANPSLGPLAGMGTFEELRGVTLRLPPQEAAIIATAKAVFEWRTRHRFCAVCGARSVSAEGGWKRVCPNCHAEHFPRTDPVVIMLAVYQDRCLMGRQAIWPQGMFSALAGFLEPGETIEEACSRELYEESGLRTVSVRYHSSQPWPFPSTLMIGLIAEVASDDAKADQKELEAVRWFSKDEVRALIAGDHPEVKAPSKMAIARTLLEAWIAD